MLDFTPQINHLKAQGQTSGSLFYARHKMKLDESGRPVIVMTIESIPWADGVEVVIPGPFVETTNKVLPVIRIP